MRFRVWGSGCWVPGEGVGVSYSGVHSLDVQLFWFSPCDECGLRFGLRFRRWGLRFGVSSSGVDCSYSPLLLKLTEVPFLL